MNVLRRLWSWISLSFIGQIQWNWLASLRQNGKYYRLTKADWDKIIVILQKNHCVLLTRRDTHLTTYLISLGNFFKTGQWAFWSHALMNLEGDDPRPDGYDFIESTGIGVHYSAIEQVLNCDAICILVPRGLTKEEWTDILYKLTRQIGKPYDTLFDYQQENTLSCVELIRAALKGMKNYSVQFKTFESMVQQTKVVTPQMLYDCEDFVKLLEIRR